MKKFFLMIWRGWKAFAHVLGIVNTRILLTVTYFVIIAIGSLFTFLGRKDPLDRRWYPEKTYWRERQAEDIDLESCRRQF